MDTPVKVMGACNAAFDRNDRNDRIRGPGADIHQSAMLEARVLLTLTRSFASFAAPQTELLSNEIMNAAAETSQAGGMEVETA
jgi:hypothetical protein